MKSLAILGVVAVVAGIGATALLAAPNDDSSARISEDDMRRATELREQLADHLDHVNRLREQARKQKDVIKLNCVNDKLVQMRPELNIADHSYTQLTGGDASAMQAIVDAAETCRKLREGADQCVGEQTLGDRVGQLVYGSRHP